jgi:hypothetical protein
MQSFSSFHALLILSKLRLPVSGGKSNMMGKLWASLGLLAITCPLLAQSTFNPIEAAKNGWSAEQDRSPEWLLAQHRKMDGAIAALLPQKKGVVDTYVIAIALDSDPVFAREASEAAKVLSRRYNAAGRTILMVAGADEKAAGIPQGSPDNLAKALAAVAARMDAKEDVLLLYTTSHGDPQTGLAYRDGTKGVGMIAPVRMAALLDDNRFKRKIVLISACYSGTFVPLLTSADSVIVTAASSRRTSFGCAPGNDWTFFGDALINHALRKSQAFEKASEEALSLIQTWETQHKLQSSDPQVFVGESAQSWLGPLETRIPKAATIPVGQPAVAMMGPVVAESR